MEMKNRPVQQKASQKVGTSENRAIPTIKPAPKKHRARVYMLKTGINGWTENDILKYCHLSSGRNYASELERCLDIQLERIDEKNPDGIDSHFRYRFVSCADVLRVIQLVNHNAAAGGYHGLSQSDIANILTLYPEAFTAA
ncbi:hypothetical protein [Serratia proteamaculans]|uniref:hypothetical protein n=1 Tax=Serratia proteamaculans TaxID=28151 RepID=UPI00217B3EA2|nr:hypothetical protein [Serratia proteamaculans]CAI1781503.1 Uncharacterised protein [Serratia proteamaculans]